MTGGIPGPSEREAVVFDFDGTLAATAQLAAAAARQALLEFGFSEERIGDAARVIGPSFPGAFAEVYGVSEEEDLEITRLYRTHYDWRDPRAFPLYPGVEHMLRRLRERGRRLAIASSKDDYKLDYSLEALGVADCFEVVEARSGRARAEKPELLARALERMGLGPRDAVMVGDRRFDVEGAHAAGLPCIGVTYGAGSPEELALAGADLVVGSVGELERLLLGTSGGAQGCSHGFSKRPGSA